MLGSFRFGEVEIEVDDSFGYAVSYSDEDHRRVLEGPQSNAWVVERRFAEPLLYCLVCYRKADLSWYLDVFDIERRAYTRHPIEADWLGR